MEFEWDPSKADKNLDKHDVSFEEASTVFADPLSTTFDDPAHSEDEDRYIIIGISSRFRLLVVAHADRDNRTRIISAREATRLERQFYEDGK